MSKKRILVVDDERDIVEIIREILEGEGYATVPAYDGQEALSVIGREPVHLVVLDIKMPVIDGFGVIETLRAVPSLAKTPIVVLTATQMIQDIMDRLRKLSVQICITKPFEPKELLSAVARALKSERGDHGA